MLKKDILSIDNKNNTYKSQEQLLHNKSLKIHHFPIKITYKKLFDNAWQTKFYNVNN